MRLALLADIHGNHLALEAVLSAANDSKCERLLIAGDFVGYYYHPREVFEMLSAWRFDAVRGNHEEMLLRGMQDRNCMEKYSKKYGSALRRASKDLKDTEMDYIKSLEGMKELEIDGVSFTLCHGSPYKVDQYVYPDADEAIITACNERNAQVLVLGHTHYPMLKTVNGKMIINPGSVGQPRDRIPGACWASFDTISRQVEFHRVPYDVSDLLKEATENDPELNYLTEVLVRQ